MKGKLSGNYLRFVPGLSIEDRSVGTGLVKDRLLECMRQTLHRARVEARDRARGWESRLVLIRN